MKPAHRDLVVYRGTSYSQPLQWWGPGEYPDGVPRDLRGWTVRLQARQVPSSTEVLVELSTENGRCSPPDEQGRFTLSLTPSDTAALSYSGVYDLHAISPDGSQSIPLLEGKFVVRRQVTQ